MKKDIQVAVIDSGVSNNIKELNYRNIRYGYSAYNSLEDSNGHGTSITYIIQSLSKNSKIIALKVFDEKLVTTTKNIISAINWCIENEVNIINISISICNFDVCSKLYGICKKAYDLGIIIVASAHNTGIPCIPAYFDCVIGVGSGFFYSNEWFQVDFNQQIQVYAKGFNIKTIDLSGNFVLLSGTSFATAIITGIIADQMYNNNNIRTFPEVSKILKKISCQYDEKNIAIYNKKYNFNYCLNKIVLNNEVSEKLMQLENIVYICDSVVEIYNFIRYYYLMSKNQMIIVNLHKVSNKETIKLKDNIYIFNDIENAIGYLETNKKEYTFLYNSNSNGIKDFLRLIVNKKLCCLKDLVSFNKEKAIYNSNYLYDSSAIINKVKQNKKIFSYVSEVPIITIINLTNVKNIMSTIELLFYSYLKNEEVNVSLITSNILSNMFGADYFLDDDIIKSISDESKYKYIKTLIESVSCNERKNSEALLTSINGDIKFNTTSIKLNIISNFNKVIFLNSDIICLIVDKSIDLSKLNEVKKFIKNIFDIENILIFNLNVQKEIFKFKSAVDNSTISPKDHFGIDLVNKMEILVKLIGKVNNKDVLE